MTPSGLSNTPPLLYQIYSLVCPPPNHVLKNLQSPPFDGAACLAILILSSLMLRLAGARGYANNKTFANTFVPPLSIENDITISFNSLAYFVLYLLISLILLLYIMHPLVNYHSSSVLIVL